ncbi:Sensor histidine kinase RcsC [anaerobic digester metagenome]
MHIPKPSKIQTKFISGLLVASIFLGIAFSVGFYVHMKNVLEEEVRDKALLIFTHVDSIQHYVRDVLRPTMYERLPSSFVIEAMSSSFISRAIMAPVNDERDGTIYRRVAIDARNPAYEANAHERELIKYFRANPDEEFWQGYKVLDGERYYLKVRSVRFEESCMYCHGQPESAPQELIALYGVRGFGKQLGAIAGVDFVGISVHSSVGRVQQTILTYFAFFALGALFFFSATNILFRVLVVNNLKRLSSVFRRNVADAEGSALLSRLEQGDEIEELVEGMEQMGDHLFEARRQLQDYAENLRRMVDERTEALSREAEARQADVRLFVRLLEDMRQSSSRAELWNFALPQICTRFGARGIGYVCTMASQNYYVWPETMGAPELPADFVDVLTGSACIQSGSRIFVPVESSSGNAEGILCLTWDSEEEAASHDRGVLLALGRQLGTAAENLTAIDSLLRQMSVLETIVEGITDPLALMDSSCAVLTVNQAARQLTSELTDGVRTDGNMLAIFFDPEAGNCPMLDAIRSGAPDQREVELPGGRSFSLSMYPVRSEEAQTDRVVVYVRETTMEKRMRAQVWHSEKMATVGKLTAGLAHEINNPLGVILCYAGLLRQTVTEPQQAADLDIIERHTRQAQRVLQELLNFARPKAAGSGTSDACAVAASVCDVFSVQAAKKRVELRLESRPGPLFVRLGIGELEQVVSNLVINALDAVDEGGGEIVVRVAPDGNRVEIVVDDNGPGVSAEDEPHIFDPFYSTKAIGAGTGLGWAVVYGMVRDVGGEVVVGRSPLGGARFVVTLPTMSDVPQAEPGNRGLNS